MSEKAVSTAGMITVRPIQFGSDAHALEVELRTKVLRTPLGLTFSEEELARESSDFHFGAFCPELIGCLILTPKTRSILKMRQVAVDFASQGLGAGKLLVAFSEVFARGEGFTEMELSARMNAVPFYLGLGYVASGEDFMEVGIPHRKLTKRI